MDFISGAWLFDGRSQGRRGGCVVVDDGRIVSVEPTTPDPLPSDGRLIHFENGFVMPGFVDAHNHLELGKGNDEFMMAQDLQPEELANDQPSPDHHAQADQPVAASQQRTRQLAAAVPVQSWIGIVHVCCSETRDEARALRFGLRANLTQRAGRR